MKRLMPLDFEVNQKEKRDAYNGVLDFINSDRCYDGIVGVIYGLRRTGKTTIMEQIMTDNSENLSFEFWEATPKDTMEDVYLCLDKAVAAKVDCVFINEITSVQILLMKRLCLPTFTLKKG